MSTSSSSSTANLTPQISNLRNLTSFLTGHDPSTGKAVVQSERPGNWKSYDNNIMAFNVIYTTSEFPVSLASDADITTHDEVMKSEKLGLVNPNGTVCRIVDFSPGYECMMHRTQSLDYGIVLEGAVTMLLDSGETRQMGRGDVAVQRATMHAWKNTSETEWARMLFVLQDCKPLSVGGNVMKEDLGPGLDGLPSSGNDN